MTLRKGSREYFYKKLDENFPGTKEKYILNFGEKYTCNSLNSNELYCKAMNLCKKLFLPVKMNFYNIPSAYQLGINF